MQFSTAEKIDLLRKRKGISKGELAERIGTTRQNLYNKMDRNNFSENDMKAIAEALGCEVQISFKMKDTGEEI